MKTKTLQTIKIKISTLRELRMIYALTGERMTEILDRIVRVELERQRAGAPSLPARVNNFDTQTSSQASGFKTL